MDLSCNIYNFKVVDLDSRIYRGGQPQVPDDFKWLENAGVTRIIKLNPKRFTLEQEMTISNGIEIMYCPISTIEQILTEPDLDSLQAAVAFINLGTFIHCEHGQDRTGLIVALYRISQGWSKKDAYDEMMRNRFHLILLGLDKAWADLT